MLQHDVIVVGGGLAGMRAALEAKRRHADVALISKVHPVRSHSVAAQGGINAPLGQSDTWESHAYDTVKGSDYLGDQDAIEALSREAAQAVVDLENMGVAFYRGPDGRLAPRNFGGASTARTYFVGAITGHAILHVMYEQLLRAGVKIYEEWFVTSLVNEGGFTAGLVAQELLTGRFHPIQAKAIILCTGGCGRVYEPSTNALICTGDGMSLAWRAGAPLMDMEMVQYHPTTLPSNGALMTEGARGDGAYLRNALGDRFMSKYAPNKLELASRDVVSRAEQVEIDEGRGVDDGLGAKSCVYLDCTHLPREFILERLGEIYEIARQFANVDITTQPVPVRPGMHYMMGGIKTNVDGRTRVPGLYAAGECACVSVHGGNRLGANSLLDTVIFGRRAGAHAAEFARQVEFRPLSEGAVLDSERRAQEVLGRPANGDSIAKVRMELGQTMHQYAGVWRDGKGLNTALSRIYSLKERYQRAPVQDKGKVFNTNLVFHWELGYMLDNAEAILVSAIHRTESRGAHYRTDCPERDDQSWLKHIVLDYRPGAAPGIQYAPVTITRWKPEKRVY
ncbi:MAG: FAD-binding protein [Chloroflexi bacterium]|nr:FAD-binding protein [Chloroflexota bacterium]